MKLWILIVALAILPLALFADAEPHTVSVGQIPLALPAPEGFKTRNLESSLPDKVKAAVTTLGNRLLAVYEAESTDNASASSSEPIFHAQTPKGTEEVDHSIQQFGEVTNSLASLLNVGEEALDESVIEHGDTKPLGVLDRGHHHFNFASIGRRADDGQLTYVAASMNNVSGKVVSLYCVVDAEPKTNRVWAQKQLATWQQAVLASNPAALPEVTSKAMSPMKRGAIIGGIAGLLGAIIGLLVLKRKKA